MEILKIENILKTYKEKIVLDHVSYDFSNSGLYFLVGKSGEGKSTLLNILAGYEKMDSGIVIKNNDLKISYIFQTDELFDELTVKENIFLPETLYGTHIENIDIIIKIFELDDLLDHYPCELSGGQKKTNI